MVASLGHVERHVGVGKHAVKTAYAHLFTDHEDFLIALFRRAPDLQVHEHIGDSVTADIINHVGHVAVILVALAALKVVLIHFIVIDHALPVAGYVFLRGCPGHGLVFVAVGPAGGDRRRRVGAVDPVKQLVVVVDVHRDFIPGFMRHQQQAQAQLGHH